MQKNNSMGKDIAVVALWQILLTGIMIGVFFLLGHFDMTVLYGGIAGAAIATGNYLVLYYFAAKAAEKAQNQDVAGGQKLIQLSYFGRMIGILITLVLLAKSGLCNVIALAIPLVFTRPILTIRELIFRKGGANE